MRLFLIALSMMATVVSKADTPVNDRISPIVLQSFESTFSNAQEVSWTATNEVYKAAFTFNGQHVTAFYNFEGALVALTRNITSQQLPIKLQTALKSNSENSWISDLFEVSSDEGTTYYVTVETANRKVVMKSIGDNSWTVYQKNDKM